MSDNSLAARAAWLSYIGGYTQSEIAKRLDVSSAKAHRLISQAQKAGLVRVFIEVPKKMNDRQKELLREFAELEEESAGGVSFFDRIVNYFS